jgi:hypothetical protein
MNSLLITNFTHFFMYLFISSPHMFRASQCPSSGDRIVLIHHLVWLVCVTAWYAGQAYQAVTCREMKWINTWKSMSSWLLGRIRGVDVFSICCIFSVFRAIDRCFCQQPRDENFSVLSFSTVIITDLDPLWQWNRSLLKIRFVGQHWLFACFVFSSSHHPPPPVPHAGSTGGDLPCRKVAAKWKWPNIAMLSRRSESVALYRPFSMSCHNVLPVNTTVQSVLYGSVSAVSVMPFHSSCYWKASSLSRIM